LLLSKASFYPQNSPKNSAGLVLDPLERVAGDVRKVWKGKRGREDDGSGKESKERDEVGKGKREINTLRVEVPSTSVCRVRR